MPVSDASGAVVALFALIVGHALADFALQGEFLSLAKNRHASLTRFFGDATPPKGVWVHALTAHSLIHAAPVWLITGSALLAFAEVVLHWAIDFAKCEGWTSFTTDQLLHIACKVLFVGLLLGGVI
ncbi:MAG: DUF3307 domain-containing protein [Akkermansiaceae bacterium]|nr:DUF3307 domain-containing protein [Akkermansiaceae bacterium]